MYTMSCFRPFQNTGSVSLILYLLLQHIFPHLPEALNQRLDLYRSIASIFDINTFSYKDRFPVNSSGQANRLIHCLPTAIKGNIRTNRLNSAGSRPVVLACVYSYLNIVRILFFRFFAALS